MSKDLLNYPIYASDYEIIDDNKNYILEKYKNLKIKLEEYKKQIETDKEKEKEYKKQIETDKEKEKEYKKQIETDKEKEKEYKKQIDIRINAIDHLKKLTTEFENNYSRFNENKKNLNNRINNCLDIQKKNIIIARSSYHYIFTQYWWASIYILILSSLITFIEAMRLIIENTEKYEIDNNNYRLLKYIIGISSLLFGILITIITGYIKFNDYQNKLEIISSRLSLLLQYNKKFEVIKFQLSTYYLPDTDIININNIERHDILTDDIMKQFVNELNKLEEDIQNNELLKYIRDKDEIKYYKEYIDSHVKDVLYDNYVQTIKKFVKCDENAMNDTKNITDQEITNILSAIKKTMYNTKDNSLIGKIKNIFFKKKDIIDIDLLTEIKNIFTKKI